MSSIDFMSALIVAGILMSAAHFRAEYLLWRSRLNASKRSGKKY